MSLINDALKRAQEQKQKANAAPTLSAPLQPIERLRQPRPTSPLIIPALLAALVCLGAGFLWFWWHGRNKAPEPVSVPVTTQPAAPVVATPPPPKTAITPAPPVIVKSSPPVIPKPPVIPAMSPKATPVIAPLIAPTVIEKTNPAPAPVVEIAPQPVVAPAPVPPPAPVFPELKLQGIFYRPSNPSALINGKTVFVGDEVSGVKVVAIERTGVKVDLDGHTKVIKLQ